MCREWEERKEDIEADIFNYFLILGQPGNVIKESIHLPTIFPCPSPQISHVLGFCR